jgi:hypothetical protein
MDDLGNIREVLREHNIHLEKREDTTGIFDHVDAFVELSQGNKTVEEVTLCPATDPADPDDDDDDASTTQRYTIWDGVATGIGNLQSLNEITIVDARVANAEEDPLAPDWEILACILRRRRRSIKLHLRMEDNALPLWNEEALPVFAEAIDGNAMITEFSTGEGIPFHCMDRLCSALQTLPALEKVSFGHIAGEGQEEGQSLESMVNLLQSPSLRELNFESVVFTNLLSQAVATALKERSGITDLTFMDCSSLAVITSALKINTTLQCLDVGRGADEVFYDVLAAALLSNSTLQILELGGFISCSWLSPLFLALQGNNGLKNLIIHGIGLTNNNKVSAAMTNGLGKNSTLESLNLTDIKLDDDDDDISMVWREALSFLSTNKTTALKALDMRLAWNVARERAHAIHRELMIMLLENKSLETLTMSSRDARFKDYLEFVDAIQPNTTLKSLRLGLNIYANEDQTKELIVVLKKNYGLEEITGLHYHGWGDVNGSDVNSIFELNRAGRRYLVQDGSSISKGVDVLGGVSNGINSVNSVFLHLLENPRLCDRSAVEMSSIGNIDTARSTSPGNHSGGKRELQAPSHTGQETRRRLE